MDELAKMDVTATNSADKKANKDHIQITPFYSVRDSFEKKIPSVKLTNIS